MRHDSDSDDDPDYVPTAEDTLSSDDEPEAKRARTSPPQPAEQGEDAKKRERDALWAQFQASVAAPQPKPSSTPPRMVKIERRYRFAGEDVVEVKEVPEDSDEAKKWPRWEPSGTQRESNPTRSNSREGSALLPSTSDGHKNTVSQSSKSLGPENSASPPVEPLEAARPSTVASGSSSAAPKATVKRPGPRKAKTTLAPLPGAQKAKKLTTLDKSAMDWRTHVQKEELLGLKDELEANRRGGGYLEKVEFLQRVEERKTDALDATKNKRRRS